MAASSERKIEANRRNARKSTGPKSPEGKGKSRRNSLKHGLSAVVVVPQEEREALEAAITAWTEQLRPEDVAEVALVHQIAAADVCMRRCATIAETALEGDAIAAVRRWEAKRRHAIRRRAQDLKDDPVNVVADLEASSFGCDWLIRRWRALDGSLRLGIAWGKQNLEEALRLLGYAQVLAPTTAGDPAAIRLWTLSIRASGGIVKAGDHFGPDPVVPEDWRQAQAELRAFVAAQIERLEGLREEVWEAVDGPEAEAVAAKALMDASKEGQARHRYERDAQMAQHRAIKLVMTLRERKRKETAEPPSAKAEGEKIMHLMVQQMVEEAEVRARAEGRAEAAAEAHRNEASAEADQTAERRRNLQENKHLKTGSSGDTGPVAGRTGPRPAGAQSERHGPATGGRTAVPARLTATKSA